MDGSWALQVTWVAIHFFGLAAAWLARKENGGHRQRLAQHSFFASLPLIAMMTVVGQVLCVATWPLSAATLGAMIVTAVIDFESSASPHAARDR